MDLPRWASVRGYSQPRHYVYPSSEVKIFHRNIGRYIFNTIAPQATLATKSLHYLHWKASQQAQYFKEFVEEQSIPTGLLSEYLLQSLFEKDDFVCDSKTTYEFEAIPRKNLVSTVSTFSHENKEYLMYPSGDFLSEVHTCDVQSYTTMMVCIITLLLL